jgi:hypothetical protein
MMVSIRSTALPYRDDAAWVLSILQVPAADIRGKSHPPRWHLLYDPDDEAHYVVNDMGSKMSASLEYRVGKGVPMIVWRAVTCNACSRHMPATFIERYARRRVKRRLEKWLKGTPPEISMPPTQCLSCARSQMPNVSGPRDIIQQLTLDRPLIIDVTTEIRLRDPTAPQLSVHTSQRIAGDSRQMNPEDIATADVMLWHHAASLFRQALAVDRRSHPSSALNIAAVPPEPPEATPDTAHANQKNP